MCNVTYMAMRSSQKFIVEEMKIGKLDNEKQILSMTNWYGDKEKKVKEEKWRKLGVRISVREGS